MNAREAKKSTKPATDPGSAWGARGSAAVSFAAALSFDAVEVSLGGNKILDALDLTLTPGEIVCLLGESGSGKSTLLRVAAGIQPIEGGAVKINDRVVSSAQSTLPPGQRGVGLMFQDFALFPHLTLMGNTLFGLTSLSRKEAEVRARAALARVGLSGREDDYPHMLSGGQQQRLALARTIAPRPGIIMLDEPFSGLDTRMRESVRAETLAVLRETHATSLIVTHDPEEAMLLGDRVALLRDGRVAQVGTAASIYHTPVDLAAARFMSPLSEIAAVVKGGQAETPLGIVPTPDRPDGSRVIIGIRPVSSLQLLQKGPGIPGRIVSRRGTLGIDICEVLVEGVEHPVRLRQPTMDGLTVGQDIFLRLNTDHVLVFDAE